MSEYNKRQWIDEILQFWFEELENPKQRFMGGKELDNTIKERFEVELERQSNIFNERVLSEIKDENHILAMIILFDQFSRNIYRGTKKAFSYDEKARMLAKYAVAQDFDMRVSAERRGFFYMPFEHSEDLNDQRESIRVFTALEQEHAGMLEWAEDHFNVIERFGRFPHRNKVLERESTPEEMEYLKDSNTYGQ